jgi:hypothetical protein
MLFTSTLRRELDQYSGSKSGSSADANLAKKRAQLTRRHTCAALMAQRRPSEIAKSPPRASLVLANINEIEEFSSSQPNMENIAIIDPASDRCIGLQTTRGKKGSLRRRSSKVKEIARHV